MLPISPFKCREAGKAMPFFKFFGLGCLYPALFERAWTEARRHPGQGVFQGSLRGRAEFKTDLNAAVRFRQWAAFGAPAHPCGVSLQCAGQGLGGGRFSGFGTRLHPFCFSPPEAHLTDVRPGAGGPECAGMRRRGAGGIAFSTRGRVGSARAYWIFSRSLRRSCTSFSRMRPSRLGGALSISMLSWAVARR